MKKILCVLLSSMLVLSFTACSGNEEVTNTNATQSKTESTQAVQSGSELTDENYDLSFTDRDCDNTYDEQTACKITFSNDTVISTQNTVTTNGKQLTISDEGTYIITGKCSDGSIKVNADDNDKIQLVFDGIDLAGSQSPLVIENADKVFITLADNSDNTLSDASSYNLTVDDSTVDATIFSKADLTFNGTGKLAVNGNYKHSIVSKDDLVITGGSYSINSTSSGIDGKDCVKIKDAEVTVNSGADAIRSTNTEETDTRGFVYLASGTFKLNSINDAIQSSSLLRIDSGEFEITTGGGSSNGTAHSDFYGGGMDRFGYDSDTTDAESSKAIKSADTIKINGGSFNINSSDDAVHSNNTAEIIGGELTIQTGDDGIHANSTLTIDGGTINITESYEGIEAGEITVNDGTISVVASDDGFNSAGGSDDDVQQGAFDSDSSKKLIFNGGYTMVNASGDGLDSNGSLEITGGVILVSGPENSGNGTLDYGTSSTITGGVIIGLGSSGMSQSITGSGQCTIMTDISTQSGNTSFALADEQNNVIASFTPDKSYSNIVISTPDIKSDGSYKIICGATVANADSHGFAQNSTYSGGSEVIQLTMSGENYSSGGNGGFGGSMGGRGHKSDRMF